MGMAVRVLLSRDGDVYTAVVYDRDGNELGTFTGSDKAALSDEISRFIYTEFRRSGLEFSGFAVVRRWVEDAYSQRGRHGDDSGANGGE